MCLFMCIASYISFVLSVDTIDDVNGNDNDYDDDNDNYIIATTIKP